MYRILPAGSFFILLYVYVFVCVCVARNIFNVISGGFGTVQKPKAASSSAPASDYREATADGVAQKLLAAKVREGKELHGATRLFSAMEGSPSDHVERVSSWLEHLGARVDWC